MASVSISCPSCSATDGVVQNPADPAACLPLFRVSGGAL
ncbi:IS1 family transposase [Escherichia coli]|nr:hypothetical protein [Escherichia coli]